LKDALVVPQAATVELQGNYLVVLVGPDNIVQPVPVKLGPAKGEMQVVVGPLKVGDKVVVGGVEKVRPGMKVNPEPYEPPKPPSHPSATPGPETGPDPKASPSPEKSASPPSSPQKLETGVVEAVVPTACAFTGPWHKGL
jgi:hypothetical protein